MKICAFYGLILLELIREVFGQRLIGKEYPTDMPHTGRGLLRNDSKIKSYMNQLKNVEVLPAVPVEGTSHFADIMVEKDRVHVPFNERSIDQVEKIQLDKEKISRYLELLDKEDKGSTVTVNLDPAKIDKYLRALGTGTTRSLQLFYRSRIKLMTDSPAKPNQNPEEESERLIRIKRHSDQRGTAKGKMSLRNSNREFTRSKRSSGKTDEQSPNKTNKSDFQNENNASLRENYTMPPPKYNEELQYYETKPEFKPLTYINGISKKCMKKFVTNTREGSSVQDSKNKKASEGHEKSLNTNSATQCNDEGSEVHEPSIYVSADTNNGKNLNETSFQANISGLTNHNNTFLSNLTNQEVSRINLNSSYDKNAKNYDSSKILSKAHKNETMLKDGISSIYNVSQDTGATLNPIIAVNAPTYTSDLQIQSEPAGSNISPTQDLNETQNPNSSLISPLEIPVNYEVTNSGNPGEQQTMNNSDHGKPSNETRGDIDDTKNNQSNPSNFTSKKEEISKISRNNKLNGFESRTSPPMILHELVHTNGIGNVKFTSPRDDLPVSFIGVDGIPKSASRLSKISANIPNERGDKNENSFKQVNSAGENPFLNIIKPNLGQQEIYQNNSHIFGVDMNNTIGELVYGINNKLIVQQKTQENAINDQGRKLIEKNIYTPHRPWITENNSIPYSSRIAEKNQSPDSFEIVDIMEEKHLTTTLSEVKQNNNSAINENGNEIPNVDPLIRHLESAAKSMIGGPLPNNVSSLSVRILGPRLLENLLNGSMSRLPMSSQRNPSIKDISYTITFGNGTEKKLYPQIKSSSLNIPVNKNVKNAVENFSQYSYPFLKLVDFTSPFSTQSVNLLNPIMLIKDVESLGKPNIQNVQRSEPSNQNNFSPTNGWIIYDIPHQDDDDFLFDSNPLNPEIQLMFPDFNEILKDGDRKLLVNEEPLRYDKYMYPLPLPVKGYNNNNNGNILNILGKTLQSIGENYMNDEPFRNWMRTRFKKSISDTQQRNMQHSSEPNVNDLSQQSTVCIKSKISDKISSVPGLPSKNEKQVHPVQRLKSDILFPQNVKQRK